MRFAVITFLIAFVMPHTGPTTPTLESCTDGITSIAERYVKLVLKIGLYDADYVDAYYGPEEWRPKKTGEEADFELMLAEVQKLRHELSQEMAESCGDDDGLADRIKFLGKQLISVEARINYLAGTRLSFDQEANSLYDAQPPVYSAGYFQKQVDRLDEILPGEGSVSSRLNEFRSQFVISKDKLDDVFKAAIDEARKRTLAKIDLPENENFVVEYVTEKSWSGYNWYKGNSYSLIQINTDLPIYIDRAIDLACHEGYPGHHVFNALLEKHLVRERNWVEFFVYPLFSPQSLIAEGSANYGIDVAFPGEQRVAFEREVLFPLAGLDPEKAEVYYEVLALLGRLSYSGNEAARNYLDGKMTKDQAVDWLVNYSLSSPERSEQRVRFFEQYRSYVINYNLGRDMVAEFVESRGGTPENPDKRWEIFTELLSNPHVPSDLTKDSK